MMQQAAWLISLALMGLVAAAFVFVATHSGRREEPFAPLQNRAYRLRVRVFWLLVAVFGGAMIYTLLDLPYDTSHAGGSGAVQVVQAKGHLWRWEVSPDRIEAGRPVEFRVSAADVNHGFGIYDPEMKLVAQVQAMPGYSNTLRHTFEQPGTYQILCLEYCGIAHHRMISEIKVVAP